MESRTLPFLCLIPVQTLQALGESTHSGDSSVLLSSPMRMPITSRNTPQAHPESRLIQYWETRGLWSRQAITSGRAPWVCPALPFHGLGKRDVTLTGFQKVEHAPSVISRVWPRLPPPQKSNTLVTFSIFYDAIILMYSYLFLKVLLMLPIY